MDPAVTAPMPIAPGGPEPKYTEDWVRVGGPSKYAGALNPKRVSGPEEAQAWLTLNGVEEIANECQTPLELHKILKVRLWSFSGIPRDVINRARVYFYFKPLVDKREESAASPMAMATAEFEGKHTAGLDKYTKAKIDTLVGNIPATRCFKCCKTGITLIDCKCCIAAYCSTKCRDEDWESIHQHECDWESAEPGSKERRVLTEKLESFRKRRLEAALRPRDAVVGPNGRIPEPRPKTAGRARYHATRPSAPTGAAAAAPPVTTPIPAKSAAVPSPVAAARVEPTPAPAKSVALPVSPAKAPAKVAAEVPSPLRTVDHVEHWRAAASTEEEMEVPTLQPIADDSEATIRGEMKAIGLKLRNIFRTPCAAGETPIIRCTAHDADGVPWTAKYVVDPAGAAKIAKLRAIFEDAARIAARPVAKVKEAAAAAAVVPDNMAKKARESKATDAEVEEVRARIAGMSNAEVVNAVAPMNRPIPGSSPKFPIYITKSDELGWWITAAKFRLRSDPMKSPSPDIKGRDRYVAQCIGGSPPSETYFSLYFTVEPNPTKVIDDPFSTRL